MSAVKLAKQQLRADISSRIASLSTENVLTQSAKACNALFQRPEYIRSRHVALYLSMDHKEVQTRDIVLHAFAHGKQVFVPYIARAPDKTSVMDMYRLHSVQDYETLQSDKWGIPSLSKESIPHRVHWSGVVGKASGADTTTVAEGSGIDLIVMPGMAFDARLGRLGHGKGYYDRFLTKLESTVDANLHMKLPALIALALDVQVLSDGEVVPTEDHDRAVDAVIVGDGRTIEGNANR